MHRNTVSGKQAGQAGEALVVTGMTTLRSNLCMGRQIHAFDSHTAVAVAQFLTQKATSPCNIAIRMAIASMFPRTLDLAAIYQVIRPPTHTPVKRDEGYLCAVLPWQPVK